MWVETTLPLVEVGKGEDKFLGTRLTHEVLDILLNTRLVVCCGRDMLCSPVDTLLVVHVVVRIGCDILVTLREDILIALRPVSWIGRSHGSVCVATQIVCTSPPQHGRVTARMRSVTVVMQEFVCINVFVAVYRFNFTWVVVDVAL